MSTSPTILAWHFVGDALRDGRPIPPDGKTLRHDGPLVMCESGLHASRRIIDALGYAPGSTICRVKCAGEMLEESDKLVCRERTILWRLDGELLLGRFACDCALSVAHLWEMPTIVRQYLETMDESLLDDASAAARAAAWAAARAAASDDASAAARAAAWAAASDAASADASAAARAAAWAAASDAASADASAAQNLKLEQMVIAKHESSED